MENPELTVLVADFYKYKYWGKIKRDAIKSQRIAESIFDFSINAGSRTAIKLAQITVDATPDGILGSITLEKINQTNEKLFVSTYSLAKIARYSEIVKRDRTQIKFLLGWIDRSLRVA